MTVLSLIAMGAGVWIGIIVIILIVAAVAWVAFRMTYAEHLPDLSAVPLFKGLDQSQLKSVARLAARVGYAPGGAIVNAGESGKGFYLIREGTAKVVVDGQDRATLGAGAYFGEIALIDGKPRSATVVASTATSVVEIPTGSFKRLLESDSSIGRAIYADLQRRLGESGAPASERVTRDQLVELCNRLRAVESTDMGQTG